MTLTDIAVRAAKPKNKPYKCTDGRGLFLFVTPAGGKLWRYKYTYAGKEKLMSLGSYPEIGLAKARQRHLEAKATLEGGRDPMDERKQTARLALLQTETYFEAVAREWHERRKHEIAENTSRNILKRLEEHIFPEVGSRPIADITAPEMLAALRKIEAKKILDTTHRVKQVCGKVFLYAIATGRAERNPVRDLAGALKTPVTKHHSYLKANELPEFLQKLEIFDGELQTKLALELLLLTFVRTGELRGAKRDEFDFSKMEWRVPPERMKMRVEHIVPLSSRAAAIASQLLEMTNSDYLLPGRQAKDFMSENTMLYALYRMGYHSKATGHGFRSTASTILNEHGFSPDAIERQLAHAERNEIRAIYNHAQYLPERRKMMQWWANYLDKAVGAAKP